MTLNLLGAFRANRFLARDDGSVTVESVMWLPVFFYILSLAVDATMIFHGYSRVIRVVEDVNRGISIGRIGSLTEGESKIAANLSNYENIATDIQIIDGVVVTRVGVPVSSMVFLGAISPLLGTGIEVRTQQYVEF